MSYIHGVTSYRLSLPVFFGLPWRGQAGGGAHGPGGQAAREQRGEQVAGEVGTVSTLTTTHWMERESYQQQPEAELAAAARDGGEAEPAATARERRSRQQRLEMEKRGREREGQR